MHESLVAPLARISAIVKFQSPDTELRLLEATGAKFILLMSPRLRKKTNFVGLISKMDFAHF